MLVRLPRTLKVRPKLMRGGDVDGISRAMHRYLEDGQLAAYEKQRRVVRETFGVGKRTLAKKAAKKAGLPQYGVVGPALYAALRDAGAFDKLAAHRVNGWAEEQHDTAFLELVHPIGLPWSPTICQRRHITAGISHNVAYDFCCPPNSTVVAPEAGDIIRLSGHPPWEDTWDSKGIYGWSIHLLTPAGYRWYITHLGRRENLRLGQRVHAGQLLGTVGDQRFRPDHTHAGVTSPAGEADALKRIEAVSRAPRVKPS